MLVKNWMSQPLVTVKGSDSVETVTKLLEDHGISLLAVVDGHKLVGLITRKDIKGKGGDLPVEECMNKAPISVPSDFSMEETADLLLKGEIDGAPVVDQDSNLLGVITQADVNRAFISMTGLWKGGIQFAFITEDRPGSIKVVVDILRECGGRIASILSSYDRVPKGKRRVFVRARALDRSRLDEMRKRIEKEVELIYVIDQRLNKREVFE
jgi:acetoin utilization protein AcuB